MSLAVDNPILNNPFEEPKEYWIYEEGLEVKGYESERIEKIIAEVRGEGKNPNLCLGYLVRLVKRQDKKGDEKMQGKDIRVIEKFESLVSQKAKIYEIRVFGSRARGDATEESDLDVLVVVDYLDHEIEKYISDCAWEAGFPEDIVIMPIAITLDTLKNSPIRESVFIKNVYAEGITV